MGVPLDYRTSLSQQEALRVMPKGSVQLEHGADHYCKSCSGPLRVAHVKKLGVRPKVFGNAIRCGPRPRLLSVLVLIPLLAACQTTMSIEEAKKITEPSSESAFVPPPRTINDITAILDEQKLDNPEAAAKAKTLADQQRPDTFDPAILKAFYHRRGLAAREVMRGQEIEDFARALDYAKRQPFRSLQDEARILFDLAIAEIHGGKVSEGLDHLRQAIQAARAADMKGSLITWNARLARYSTLIGDLESAEAAMQESLIMHQQSRSWRNQEPRWIAERDATVAGAQASLLEAKGRFDEAEKLHRASIAAWASNPATESLSSSDGQISRLALLLLRQGRLLEAEYHARTALLGALRKYGRNSNHTANMLRILTRVVAEQGRYDEAERLARATVDIYRKTGSSTDSFTLALARDEMGALLVAQSRWPEALAEYEQISIDMSSDPETYQRHFGGNVNRALVLLNSGRLDQTLEILKIALNQTKRVVSESHQRTGEIRGFIAIALAARGDQAGALKEFRDSAPVLLTRQGDVNDESEFRSAGDQRIGLILNAYIGLLASIRGSPLEQEAGLDAAAEAFRLADVARASSVQRALDATAARAAAREPALADLVRREQDAAKQLSAFYGLLAGALSIPTDQQDPKVVSNLRTRIETLRRSRQVLSDQITRLFPAYAELINPQPTTVEHVRAALRPDEILLSTFVTPERTFVWAIPPTGPMAFAAAPLGEASLARTVNQLRKALDPSGTSPSDIPAFDLARAYELYRVLFEPVRAGWLHAKTLLVVPHGPLGQLPLTLLPTQKTEIRPGLDPLFASYRHVPWLIRTHAVTVLPSATSLVTLRALPPGDSSRRPFVGFGDPYFSTEQAARATRQIARAEPAPVGATAGSVITVRSSPKTRGLDSSQLAMLPRLPDTADEVRSIALAVKADLNMDVFVGVGANEKTVKTLNLSAYRVLAFATHGLVPGDLDGLTQPALALTAPNVAQIDGDGLLTLEEILALRLDADWVVLSACNTASANGGGSEAVSGLGRAFFYAGARALLVSNWPVETTSARALTTELFRRQEADPELTRAQAFQQTLNWMIDSASFIDPRTRQVVFSYAHPIFWAPFTLVGDSGGVSK